MNNNTTNKDTLQDRIAALRHVFQAVDFDTSLWDSLFGVDPVLMSKAHEATISSPAVLRKKKAKNTRSTSNNKEQADSAAAASAVAVTPDNPAPADTTNNINATSPSTSTSKSTSTSTSTSTKPPPIHGSNMKLAHVLTFLEITNNKNEDDNNDGDSHMNESNNNNHILDNYLQTAPAYRGLEDFAMHHPHLHDSLLQCITMGLSHAMCTYYMAYLEESSQSVDDWRARLDGAIQLVTQHNLCEMGSSSTTTTIKESTTPTTLATTLSMLQKQPPPAPTTTITRASSAMMKY